MPDAHRNCVKGITANRELLAERVRTSAGLATALNPISATRTPPRWPVKRCSSGRSVTDIVLEKGFMTAEHLEAALRPRP